MSTDKHSSFDGKEEQGMPALTVEQAKIWRLKHRVISPWFILLWQVVAGLCFSAIVWFLFEAAAAYSLLYGVLAVALPALPFALAMTRQANLMLLMVWEFVKLLLSVLLLVLAQVVLGKVIWLALLGGVVLAINMYWLAPLMIKRSPKAKSN